MYDRYIRRKEHQQKDDEIFEFIDLEWCQTANEPNFNGLSEFQKRIMKPMCGEDGKVQFESFLTLVIRLANMCIK